MEAMLGLISMQVELGVVMSELLEDVGGLTTKYTCVPMRMEIRSILKSLGWSSRFPSCTQLLDTLQQAD